MFPALETELKQEVGSHRPAELHRNPALDQKVHSGEGTLAQLETLVPLVE
jgi:hypothetical protein